MNHPTQKTHALFVITSSFLIHSTAVGGEILHWKCSTKDQPWSDRADVPLGETQVFTDAQALRVLVSSSNKLQQIDGWGGCFNERGWKAIMELAPADRKTLMDELFHPTKGLRLNLGRTPIGASDYAIDLYSLNETSGDFAMEKFSIERDRKWLIPYLKAAQSIRPDLKLWASPWSPPSWMKHNGGLSGARDSNNRIKDDPQTLDALALYFARYVEEYAKEGIRISMVMPQNEPNMATNYTSCLWTGEQLAKFIGHHLGPTFDERKLDSEIYLGTINDDDKRGGYAYWVEPSVRDLKTRSHLDGLGCQWAAASTMAETHLFHPEMNLMQTESECGNHENDWKFAEYQFGLAMKWFEAGASSNILWNLVLDETGLSTGGWAQCSPIVIDTKSRKVIHTPYFHLYQHFSHFIEPGAHMLATVPEKHAAWGDRLAFVNPDGGVVIVVANRSDQEHPLTLNIDGKRSGIVRIPARSFSTFQLETTDR